MYYILEVTCPTLFIYILNLIVYNQNTTDMCIYVHP